MKSRYETLTIAALGLATALVVSVALATIVDGTAGRAAAGSRAIVVSTY